MATLTHQGALLVSSVIFTCLPELFATSCQVYPSEYAYHVDSVIRAERVHANCKNYYSRISFAGIHPQDYIHCNGTQLKLADSDLGSELFRSSNYYVWPPGTRNNQLLFIFPTRVNLTTITLHYYSDSVRGLPRLRFFAVRDDFDIWDAPSASYGYYVEVAAVPSGGEPAGRKNISITFNFNTAKVLMYKFQSQLYFALSEVEFFVYVATTAMPMITNISESALPTAESSTSTSYKLHFATQHAQFQTTDSIMDCNCHTLLANSSFTSVREVIVWTLVAVSTALFVGSLTINIIMLWIYKKRQRKDNNVETAMCEMEGNPCYETSNLKKTVDTAGLPEVHVYERVNQN